MGDGDLVRYIDGELEGGRRAAVEAHLATCAACEGRLADLRHTSDALSTLLADAQPPGVPLAPVPAFAGSVRATSGPRTPDASRGRAVAPAWLRAAAVVALLGVGLASVEPVRARIAAGWRAVAAFWTDPPAAPSKDGTAVGFTPADNVFVIEFASRQRMGRAVIHVDSGRTVRARIERSGDGEELLVLPSGLGVRNTPASAASYRITLPAALRRIEVRIAGRRVAAYSDDATPPDSGWLIELAAKGRR